MIVSPPQKDSPSTQACWSHSTRSCPVPPIRVDQVVVDQELASLSGKIGHRIDHAGAPASGAAVCLGLQHVRHERVRPDAGRGTTRSPSARERAAAASADWPRSRLAPDTNCDERTDRSPFGRYLAHLTSVELDKFLDPAWAGIQSRHARGGRQRAAPSPPGHDLEHASQPGPSSAPARFSEEAEAQTHVPLAGPRGTAGFLVRRRPLRRGRDVHQGLLRRFAPCSQTPSSLRSAFFVDPTPFPEGRTVFDGAASTGPLISATPVSNSSAGLYGAGSARTRYCASTRFSGGARFTGTSLSTKRGTLGPASRPAQATSSTRRIRAPVPDRSTGRGNFSFGTATFADATLPDPIRRRSTWTTPTSTQQITLARATEPFTVPDDETVASSDRGPDQHSPDPAGIPGRPLLLDPRGRRSRVALVDVDLSRSVSPTRSISTNCTSRAPEPVRRPARFPPVARIPVWHYTNRQIIADEWGFARSGRASRGTLSPASRARR